MYKKNYVTSGCPTSFEEACLLFGMYRNLVANAFALYSLHIL